MYIDPKFKIRHWDQNSNIPVHRPYNHLSGHPRTFPPGYPNLGEVVRRLRESRAQKEQLSINALLYCSSTVVKNSCVKLSSRINEFQGSGHFASQPIYFLKNIFRISYFVFRTSYFVYRILHIVYRITYFVLRISYFVFRIPYFVFCIPYFVFRMSYFVFRTSYLVFRISYFVFRISYSVFRISYSVFRI